MSTEFLSTDPYKGVRDFYPEDMAIQQFIFDTWSKTAESFGYDRYDASALEPSALYRNKGAVNEEMVNEQTYTFTDRGDREVTLRPEMTPTVARMIAKKQKELAFPVRWYSIPNLFRYERMQKGRLREHWQLNCDLFGPSTLAGDVEMIQLAHSVFKNFGATDEQFEILVNNRTTMNHAYAALGITDADLVTQITRLNDRKDKISNDEYLTVLTETVGDASLANDIKAMIETNDPGESQVVSMLKELGISNVRLDRSLARGFDYYTGTIFEIKDRHPDNNRALCGGGRYDNLTGMFSSEAVSGIGFGLGDVTMRDFLETHNLLPNKLSQKELIVVIPATNQQLHKAMGIAETLRQSNENYSVTLDFNERPVPKRIESAKKKNASGYVLVDDSDNQSIQRIEN